MNYKRKKVSIIGAGATGATTALMIAQKELADLVLLATKENQTKGKALDLLESTPILGVDVKIKGTTKFEDTKDSDLVIITAGMTRKPGMSRDDLLSINTEIMESVTKEVIRYSPHCKIIVLTNPVDVMTYTVLKTSGFPKNRILGQSGVLDSARFRTFIAEALNVSVKDVFGFVLGGHGDTMVPLIRYSSVAGIPLTKLMSQEQIDGIIERTRKGGGEIVSLLGNGSAYYAPSASIVEMAEAILKDQRRVLPAIAYLEGEYGYHDLCLGVPTILGERGLEQIIELDLTDEERKALDHSAYSVKKVLDGLKEKEGFETIIKKVNK